MSVDRDKILEAFEEAENEKQELSSQVDSTREAIEDLKEMVATAHEFEGLDDDAYDDIMADLEDADLGAARSKIAEALRESELQFDDEEKQSFATAFSDVLDNIEEHVELIRNDMMQLAETDRSQKDLIDLLYGKHSKFTKTELRQFFKAINGFDKTGVTTDDMARVIAAYNTNVNIGTACEILQAIQQVSK